MYKLKLFKRDVLVNGRYKRSFECLDNGIVYLIDYKNGLVHGSYKVYGDVLAFLNKKLIQKKYNYDNDTIEYITFRKNKMILDYYATNCTYYINRIATVYCIGVNSHISAYIRNNIRIYGKDNSKFDNYKDVLYMLS